MEKVKEKKNDYLNGKVFGKLVRFAIPLAIATFLQMLFNAADLVVVGQMSWDKELGATVYQGAVGATTSLMHLIVNLFIGISIGANVAMANAFGAKDEARQKRVVHTSLATSLASGLLVLVVGVIFARPLLQLIKTPDNLIDYSTRYLQIYFIGAPAVMVYNFGASLMRGVGETKKPLLYLLVAGVLNVIINVVCVVCFDLNVVGVALGTTVSQYVAAIWIVADLRRSKDEGLRLEFKKIRFHGKELKNILLIGIPMGISSCCFSLSNLLIQSTINSYGFLTVTGNTVGGNIEGFVDAFANSCEKAVVTFIGQNMGAKKPERFRRIIGAGFVACFACEAVYSILMLCFGRYVCMIYNADPAVLDEAMKRVMCVSIPTFVVSLMYTFGAALRGMGYSILPMIVNLTLTCVFRVVYIMILCPPGTPVGQMPPIEYIYIIYPITWLASGLCQMGLYFLFEKKVKQRFATPVPISVGYTPALASVTIATQEDGQEVMEAVYPAQTAVLSEDEDGQISMQAVEEAASTMKE